MLDQGELLMRSLYYIELSLYLCNCALPLLLPLINFLFVLWR